MLSDATYSRLASTNVMTDFVELPSQLMEHWFSERSVLEEHAKHFETGESVPQDLLDKLEAAQSFNQGFGTVEYTVCALLDMAMHHEVDDYDKLDLVEFEKRQLERLGLPQGIVMRHRPAHFLHLFATEMYSAGYYGKDRSLSSRRQGHYCICLSLQDGFLLARFFHLLKYTLTHS